MRDRDHVALDCDAGLVTEDEIATLVAELKRLACDDSVLLAQARMPAVLAVQ